MSRQQPTRDGQYTVDDGLGVRWVEVDAAQRWTEVLEVAPVIASYPAVDQAMRAHAARLAVEAATMATVRRIERHGDALRVVAAMPQGVRLSDLLADLEFGTEVLTDAGVLELAMAVIGAVAAVHDLPGEVSHGALTPSHVRLTCDGTAMLTDGVFGTALEQLKMNREQLWREFGVVLPASASLPRFDQRADVTQLGAVVLAITLRRTLRSDEYPRGIGDLVLAATPEDGRSHTSALRMWLQQAMQLHPRAVFGSALEARLLFGEVAAAAGVRLTGAEALKAIVRKRFSNLRAN